DDVQKMLHDGMWYGNDSLLMAQNIVGAWIEHQLFSTVAVKNIPNMDEIEEKVKEYRHSLLIHEYMKQMIASNESLISDVSADSIEDFYQKNKSHFTLKSPIIKGILVRVDNSDSELPSIKRWMKRGNNSDIENIEKSALKSTVSYQYFQDAWADLDKVASLLPGTDKKLESQLFKNNSIELADNNYTYILKISDYRKQGEVMPLDFAESQIKEIFVMTNQQKFEQQLKKSLIEEALDDNELQFYDSTMIKNL
ncbi:MAG: peptidyl-prolyl cis-trans isomerase, partial [Muribaculaceae bacterium]|nr:peptidyl-prolyl cis-trans isomerase [Muribaculaceae bacterium]